MQQRPLKTIRMSPLSSINVSSNQNCLTSCTGIDDGKLAAQAWGEPIDVLRRERIVEVKGATHNEPKIEPEPNGRRVVQSETEGKRMSFQDPEVPEPPAETPPAPPQEEPGQPPSEEPPTTPPEAPPEQEPYIPSAPPDEVPDQSENGG